MKTKTWETYKSKQSIKSNSAISKSIIEELANIPLLLRQNSESEELTNQIKFILVKLGYQNGYCVYTCLKKSKSNKHKIEIDNKREKLLNEIDNVVSEAKIKYDLGDHKFRNTEWLYDIHWYNDDADYCPKYLILIAESELGKHRIEDTSKHPYPAVRFDFQKLLVANAQLRLLIFRISDLDYLYNAHNGLAKYFEHATKVYQCLEKGSRFLFICFCKNEVLFKEFTKR